MMSRLDLAVSEARRMRDCIDPIDDRPALSNHRRRHRVRGDHAGFHRKVQCKALLRARRRELAREAWYPTLPEPIPRILPTGMIVAIG